MTMFQILTQKGWLDIMHSTMRQSEDFSPLVAVYFVVYHLFVTLVRVFKQKNILLYDYFIYFLLLNVLNVSSNC